MRLTKKNSVAITVAIIVAFFATGFLFMKRSPTIRTKPLSPATGSSSSREAEQNQALSPDGESGTGQFQLTEFHRSEIREGKKLWEVHGTRGRYFPETSSANIDQVHMVLFDKKGEPSDLKAQTATIFLSAASLTKGIAKGRVIVVRNNEVTLTTEEAIIDRVANTVEIPTPLTITAPQGSLVADHLSGNIESKEFVFLGNVLTTIEPGAKRSPFMTQKESR